VIPDPIDIGSPWKVLPAGIHDASLEEVRMRYATNENRRRLFDGLTRAVAVLRAAGCKAIYLDGSFVGDNSRPGDFDVCWVPVGVDSTKLDPVLLDFSKKRQAQKAKYHGEFFPTTLQSDFLSYFQKDKDTGKPKGIIRLH
jgi:hypothetical protein